ncbi:hypothetical protein ARMSODRAFT_1027653 [Armillaria solidipes]|uniref:Uncharacterized protein n=1 Tax=Armillaria solidipes TaxID=1076256 RepID=A0A2H3B7Z7_9AGAR|nr:hypothetical protein ARMSODRAFT_1027653 [Armillaria solidipes]
MDVVIVGSGITSAAFARTLLDADGSMEAGMLGARDACSGATARSGRHITPPLYRDYHDLKKKHDAQAVKQIIKFWLSHLDGLISVACRKVDTYDIFFIETCLREKLGRYLEELPSEKGGWGMTEGPDGDAARGQGVRGHLDDGQRGTSISACYGNSVKAAQDVLVIPAVHAHSLFFHL